MNLRRNVYPTFDYAMYDILRSALYDPQYECSPRGSLIKELIAPTFELRNPRARLIHNPERKMNYGFSVGEFLWYWQGREDLEMMQHYNKRMKDFSDDGKTLNSAYGKRLMTNWVVPTVHGPSQWQACVQTLLADSDSRRAVMLINRAEDEIKAATVGSKDVPCTLSLQFFVRDNKLNLHVVMRSNDIIWGLCNDLFSFTLFQECMLLDLRKHAQFETLELGSYYHTAGSLHLYERHFEQAEMMLEAYRKKQIETAMEPLTSLEDLVRLCQDEELLRARKTDKIDETRYSSGLRWMVGCLNGHRERRDAEGVQLL